MVGASFLLHQNIKQARNGENKIKQMSRNECLKQYSPRKSNNIKFRR
jgi:hypothetical protein